MKTIDIKAGTILLWKEYGKIKKALYKLIGKPLEYNRWNIYTKDVSHLCSSHDYVFPDAIMLEPKKIYSKKESNQLRKCLIFDCDSEFCPSVALCGNISTKEMDRLLIAVNSVRPNTFDSTSFTLDSIKNSKYYREV